MNTNKKYALIVAGGKGNRMQTEIPKQFLLVLGKPILMHTLETFYNYDSKIECILVLPEHQIAYWKSLCEEYNFTLPHIIVTGGSERFYSVLSGLDCIHESGLVAIHDGVRPLVSKELIERGFETAEKYGSAIPIVDSIDSLRNVTGDSNFSIDRSSIKRVQTPQIFDCDQIKQAYKLGFEKSLTDDASVWEKAGKTISCYQGDEKNIKITTQIDIVLAEAILKNIE